jgi:phospholipase C
VIVASTAPQKAIEMKLLLLVIGAALLAFNAQAQTNLVAARQHIRHVIIIMQENRSFDNYFGTFPGANGIPAGTCVPNSPTNPTAGCTAPFHNTQVVEAGGPHGHFNYLADYDNGKMDGFILQQLRAVSGCVNPTSPKCVPSVEGLRVHDVVGYHTASEIPNYWTYAKQFTLQDELFESVASWSYGAHLSMVSGWFAKCASATDPLTCKPVIEAYITKQPLAWTYLPWLLDRNAVSWKYYLGEGLEPDCADGAITCDPVPQDATVYGFWNPIPTFELFSQSVSTDPRYKAHVANFANYEHDVANGTLPAVAWIVPGDNVSEHPPSNIRVGMNYVTSIVNAIARSKYSKDTVIIIAWDDWGGFYDHVLPPISHEDAQKNVFGWSFRVPGIIISAWAKPGYIDHQYMSFDQYNKFIEDLFLKGERLDPKTDGRPDNRPVVTETIPTVRSPFSGAPIHVGDLLNDFDFAQPARPIPILPQVQ